MDSNNITGISLDRRQLDALIHWSYLKLVDGLVIGADKSLLRLMMYRLGVPDALLYSLNDLEQMYLKTVPGYALNKQLIDTAKMYIRSNLIIMSKDGIRDMRDFLSCRSNDLSTTTPFISNATAETLRKFVDLYKKKCRIDTYLLSSLVTQTAYDSLYPDQNGSALTLENVNALASLRDIKEMYDYDYDKLALPIYKIITSVLRIMVGLRGEDLELLSNIQTNYSYNVTDLVLASLPNVNPTTLAIGSAAECGGLSYLGNAYVKFRLWKLDGDGLFRYTNE